MREFQEKKRRQRLIYSKISIVVLIFLVLFMAKATYGVYKKERESAANKERVAQELATIQARQDVVSSDLHRIATEQGMEQEIRSKYSVSKPGETMIVIVGTGTPRKLPPPPQTWWSKVTSWFK
jgi:cell division protein FtsB